MKIAKLDFEWDDVKDKENIRKHRVSFDTAAEAFASKMIERVDDREDYGEVRWIALGRRDTEVQRGLYMARREPDPHHQCPESE